MSASPGGGGSSGRRESIDTDLQTKQDTSTRFWKTDFQNADTDLKYQVEQVTCQESSDFENVATPKELFHKQGLERHFDELLGVCTIPNLHTNSITSIGYLTTKIAPRYRLEKKQNISV